MMIINSFLQSIIRYKFYGINDKNNQVIFLIFLKQNDPLYKCNFMLNLIYKTDKGGTVLLEIQTFPSCQPTANLESCWVLCYTERKHQAKVIHCNPIY